MSHRIAFEFLQLAEEILAYGISILRVEQRLHIALREGRSDRAAAIEKPVGERTLSGLELVHLLLDRPGGHQPVNEDGLVLPDPIRPDRSPVPRPRDSTRDRR